MASLVPLVRAPRYHENGSRVALYEAVNIAYGLELSRTAAICAYVFYLGIAFPYLILMCKFILLPHMAAEAAARKASR